jgi:hypothetical protein
MPDAGAFYLRVRTSIRTHLTGAYCFSSFAKPGVNMQDSKPTGPRPASRRGFFLGAAAVGAAAAAVKVLPAGDAPAEPTAAVPAQPAPEKGGGYTLSEHVKRYYRSTSA